MKNLKKLLFIAPMLFFCCERQEGFDNSGPISSYLLGTWELQKTVSKVQTKIGSQIGYSEIIESGNDKTNDYDRVFKNDTLTNTYIWSRDPWPVGDATKMTVLVTYRNGLKRFFKIYREFGKDDILETSGYLSEIGSAQDSVKYYYSRKN